MRKESAEEFAVYMTFLWDVIVTAELGAAAAVGEVAMAESSMQLAKLRALRAAQTARKLKRAQAAAKAAEAAKGVGQLGFKEVQALTKTYSTELNAFFKSGGSQMASKDALLSYKELATRILNGTGGAPATKLTEKALKVQTQRLEMINKALETLK